MQASEHITEAWIRTSWIVAIMARGNRDGKPFYAVILFLTSLRFTLPTLLQLVRELWSHDACHWMRGPVASGWVVLDPHWIESGDGRHHGTAGDGAVPTGIWPSLKL